MNERSRVHASAAAQDGAKREAAPAGIDWEVLVDAAVRSRARAYAPYSGFQVGAALLAENGRVYNGCNVENRVLGLTLCAERGALSAAVADGCANFLALAIAADASPPCAPCGQCRDALAEFVPRLPIVSVTVAATASPRAVAECTAERKAANWRRFELQDLLPARFVLDRG